MHLAIMIDLLEISLNGPTRLVVAVFVKLTFVLFEAPFSSQSIKSPTRRNW